MERSILPALATEEFGLTARTAVVSFIVAFGLTKAASNYVAGRLCDAHGRRAVLIGGWLLAAPVAPLLMWAPSWNWIILANVLLGASQGLAWSATVIMKIELAGPSRRGLAMGLNEFAGYLAVAVAALLTGHIAVRYGLRPEPFFLGLVAVAAGLLLSVLVVRETRDHAALEATATGSTALVSARDVFWRTTWRDRDLSSVTQAGLVNNGNDGMAWGLLPLYFAGAGLSVDQIGTLAALYPASWGMAQLVTGGLSDRLGRKWIVGGMWLQALAIVLLSQGGSFGGFAGAMVILGLGTALVYPTLLAAVGDVASPSWRASAVGVYRFWRDMGYAVGALASGVVADVVGIEGALYATALATAASGVIVAQRMSETHGAAAGRPGGA